jgi:hypothetical protein
MIGSQNPTWNFTALFPLTVLQQQLQLEEAAASVMVGGLRSVLVGQRSVMVGQRSMMVGRRSVMVGRRSVMVGQRSVMGGLRCVLVVKEV